ncbi:hypothetical protein V8B97DRAFT_1989742 [Scleroderma yunnanense]
MPKKPKGYAKGYGHNPCIRLCPHCQRGFLWERSLREHASAEHGRRGPIRRPQMFTSWEALQNYRDQQRAESNTVTGVVQPTTTGMPQKPQKLKYICDKCIVVFHFWEMFAEHKREVHGRVEGNHSTRTSRRIERQNQHGAVTHPTTYECDCGDIFPSAELLDAHYPTHSIIACLYCTSTFNSFDERDEHQTRHLTYPCDSCDQVFCTSEALEQHKRDGHDFYCCYCSYSFATAVLRNQHECFRNMYGSCEYAALHTYSLQQRCKTTGHVSMHRSPSTGSSSPVVDDSSPSSPSVLRCSLLESDSSSKSDIEQSKSRTPSESQVSVGTDPELDRDGPDAVDVTLAMSDARGALEYDPDDHCTVPDVQSELNSVSPDEYQTVHNCLSCRWVFQSDEDLRIHECGSSQKREVPLQPMTPPPSKSPSSISLHSSAISRRDAKKYNKTIDQPVVMPSSSPSSDPHKVVTQFGNLNIGGDPFNTSPVESSAMENLRKSKESFSRPVQALPPVTPQSSQMASQIQSTLQQSQQHPFGSGDYGYESPRSFHPSYAQSSAFSGGRNVLSHDNVKGLHTSNQLLSASVNIPYYYSYPQNYQYYGFPHNPVYGIPLSFVKYPTMLQPLPAQGTSEHKKGNVRQDYYDRGSYSSQQGHRQGDPYGDSTNGIGSSACGSGPHGQH